MTERSAFDCRGAELADPEGEARAEAGRREWRAETYPSADGLGAQADTKVEAEAARGTRGSGMDAIEIIGGSRLNGTIPISGAKNAALPLMTACLLTDEKLTLTNLPFLADIDGLIQILEGLGVTAQSDGGSGFGERALTLDASTLSSAYAPYDLVRKMRASFLVLGPLLARHGEATVSLPGGCAIGTRPVDLHLEALAAMGADISLEGGYVTAKAPKGGLTGGTYRFPKVSVGATENALMAAALARGTTVLENAAREPEIGDLADCLTAMGAKIEGAGTHRITVEGVERLHGAEHMVIPDRIETGTFMLAVATAGGEVELTNTRVEAVSALLPVLEAAGISVRDSENGVIVTRNGARPVAVEVTTEPYPGFPTDLQAQLVAFAATANGTSRIKETIFENRFMHVPELCRMGARIVHDGQTAMVEGVPRLTGAPVMATDLRASVSLVIAGLAAAGKTTVNRVYHLDRGFERIEEKLGAVGADITRVRV